MEPIIAIIDDDEDIRDATSLLMETYKWEVSAYATSKEFFFDLATGHVPDCAIIDLHLPEMNGVEIMEELAYRDFEIPIIILSVLEDGPLVDHAIELGATVLNEPTISEKLTDAINEMFLD